MQPQPCPHLNKDVKNPAHSYSGLFIKDDVPLHDVERNPLQTSPDDSEATVITG